jgi:hypothetical protein
MLQRVIYRIKGRNKESENYFGELPSNAILENKRKSDSK